MLCTPSRGQIDTGFIEGLYLSLSIIFNTKCDDTQFLSNSVSTCFEAMFATTQFLWLHCYRECKRGVRNFKNNIWIIKVQNKD